jgi:hypothetical protein
MLPPVSPNQASCAVKGISLFGAVLALAACDPTYKQAVLEPMQMADGTVVQNAFSHARIDGCAGHTVTAVVTGFDFITNKHHGFDEISVNTEVGNNGCANLATGVGIAVAGAVAEPAHIDNSSVSNAASKSIAESLAIVN